MKNCKIEGCQGRGTINPNGVEIFSLGYCNKHYQRFKIHGDSLYEEKSATCCSIEGCQNKGAINKNGTETFALGYCMKHYMRFNTHGDPLFVKTIHGEDRKKNSLYSIYCGIKNRCYDKNCKNYKNYGGRGIIMSDEWLGLRGFDQFILDMGKRSDGYSIDRIDVNGNYTKENCRWANNHQQAANTRTNNKIVGVHWDKKSNKWQASIMINKKSINLGFFINYDEAVAARKAGEIKYGIVY